MAHATDPNHHDRDRLIEEHIELAEVIARHLRAKLAALVPVDDLVAYGRQGLLDAASRFDKSKDVKFITFAWTRIRGAIFDGARLQSWFPRNQHAAPRSMDSNPDAAPVPVPMMMVPYGSDYLDATNPPPEDRIDLDRLRQRIRAAVAELPLRERQIAERRYFADDNFTEIRADLGLSSKFYVSRVHARALRLLREKLSNDSGVAAARGAR